MSRLLVDTTVLIDAERAREPVDTVVADDDDVAVAAVTIAELLVGVELGDGPQRESRRHFVDAVRAALPVIPYDVRAAEAHAALIAAMRRAGRPRGAHDLIIAATALASGRTVLTGDAAGFEGLPGVAVLRHR